MGELTAPIIFHMISFDDYKAQMGALISNRRKEAGLSLRRFGLMVGVHFNQLQRIEQGKVNPSLETLYKIAQGLDVEVADLLPVANREG